jgi:superfamily II DNA or RNA helicase
MSLYYTDDNFLNKMEFLENKSENKKSHIHQEPTQMLLRNYISKVTPFESVLLYHEVGVGKTCTSITIAEGFKEYIYNMGKRILVLVKNKNIEKNFMGELLSKCTREEYLDNEEYDIYSGKANTKESERNEIIHKATKIISKSYQFVTYGTFINRVLGAKEFEKDEYGNTTKKVKRTKTGEIKRKPIKDEIKNLNNTVIIVDEAHNVTGNEVYTSLMKVLSKSYNYRLVLLTATPIYDNSTEIFELANLLNVNNESLQFPIGNMLLKQEISGDSYLTKKRSEYINRSVLKGDIYEITEFGKKKLNESLKGKVSYLRANTETNPKKFDIGTPLINITGTTNIVLCEMSPYQYKTYINALKTDLGEFSKYDMSTAIKLLESEENISEKEISVSKASSLYKNSSDASTMTYPDHEYGKTGFLNTFSFNKTRSKYTLNDKKILTTDLINYSSKLYNLLENINKNDRGNVFIYSNYVNYGGTSLLRQLFLNNGFFEFSNKNMPETKHYKSFTVFDESTSLRDRENFKRIFNNEDNKDGKYIRIIIGSPILSEGITLKAVRQVHILEPYWNMSKINQIIGRAVRNYSHHALEPQERTVEIYKYVSVFYKNGDRNLNSVDDLSKFFIDREKYILSEEKDRSNKIIERQLKITSFDCSLNLFRNKIVDGIDGSAECDYTKCNYECEHKPKSDRVDKSTYKMYLTFFNQFDIYYILETLKMMFQQSFIWNLDDIQLTIKKLEPLISEETIYTTLNYIVENKVFMFDMYGREGFIIRTGDYYIFNDADIDINTSIYSKILDFSTDVNKYSLDEYTKNFLNINLFQSDKIKDKGKIQSDGLKPEKQSTLDLLSEEQLEYNRQIEENYTIYGTYRMKKTKEDSWDHKYGKRDEKFRILDIRNAVSKQKDQRKDITGKAATSYEIPELRSIAKALDIEINGTHNKPDLVRMIKRVLESQSRILK